jgi:plastocyanin
MALESRLATATVSFGAWHTEPPLDRFPNASPPEGNHHQLIPQHVVIPAGGTVNFIISGLHQVIVYDDGTQPADIDVTKTTTTTGTPADVVLIDDPASRIYRGVDPSLYPRDRSEVVTFPKAGIYLVICGVRDHFVEDGMFGFVTVLPLVPDTE